jgi:hypothetical protein
MGGFMMAAPGDDGVSRERRLPCGIGRSHTRRTFADRGAFMGLLAQAGFIRIGAMRPLLFTNY